MRRIFLTRSLGCRLNAAEMMEVERKLEDLGWRRGDEPSLVIINSCAVTRKAEKETRQLIRQMRRKYPKAKLLVTGCFAGYDQLTEGAKKMRDLADRWVLNKDKDKLVEIMEL